MHQTTKAINLFSHSGGLAMAAMMNNIECVMYTTHSLPLKCLLQDKIEKGQLSKGEIHKFVYNIRSDEVKDKADLLIGLVTADVYQFREGAIPNERGLFSNSPRTDEDALHTHTKTVHEITLLAKAASASRLIFIFTYDPLIGPTASIFLNRGFKIKVFQFACTGPLNLSSYLYCVVATPVSEMPVEDVIEIEENLSVGGLLPVTQTDKVVTTPTSLMQRIVLWDIPPCVADQILKKVLADRQDPEAQVLIIKSTVKSKCEHWDYNKLELEDIFDLSRQPVTNPIKAAKLLGWPQEWAPGLLY